MRNLWRGVVVAMFGFGCGDAPEVSVVPDSPVADAPIDAFDGECSLLTQEGCSSGEKCTWYRTQDNPPIGSVGCAPDLGPSAIPVGSVCTNPPAGPLGYDSCARGSVCLAGICKQFCDFAGGTLSCPQNFACAQYANFAMDAGVTLAGVCDPGCDPLTQDLLAGSPATACGSPQPAQPSKGCFRTTGTFGCAPSGSSNLVRTDRAVPFSNGSGAPYSNGCAPGFIPLVMGPTGSMTNLCAGLCAALEIDNTPAHVGNAKGNAAALAKLPTQSGPLAGDGTCNIGKKGSHASSTCKFIWPLFKAPTTGLLPPEFQNGPLLDTLGACQAVALYSYDSNNDSVPDAPVPDCTMLPPRSGTTTGAFDDAADWGCQKFSSSQFTSGHEVHNAVVSDTRVTFASPVPLMRHSFN